MKFTLTPEAEAIIRRAHTTADQYDRIVSSVMEKVVNNAVKDVRRRIVSQNFPNAYISDSWMAYKRAHGLDSRVLIATRNYMNSFRPVKIGASQWAVQADQTLFTWLNEGTSRMAPRDHWSPVEEKAKRDMPAMIAKEVARALSGG